MSLPENPARPQATAAMVHIPRLHCICYDTTADEMGASQAFKQAALYGWIHGAEEMDCALPQLCN